MNEKTETKPIEEKPVKKTETKSKETEKTEEKKEIKPKEKTVKTEKKPSERKIKKDTAQVNSFSLPISTKQSIAVCKFIKGKEIERAISDLEQVILKKKAVPMKGEIPHRKGKGMMSGRFPKNTSEKFIKLLKTLKANSSINNLENPVISEAVANIASRPFGRFGRVQRKRTHVRIIAREKPSKINKKKNKKQ